MIVGLCRLYIMLTFMLISRLQPIRALCFVPLAAKYCSSSFPSFHPTQTTVTSHQTKLSTMNHSRTCTLCVWAYHRQTRNIHSGHSILTVHVLGDRIIFTGDKLHVYCQLQTMQNFWTFGATTGWVKNCWSKPPKCTCLGWFHAFWALDCANRVHGFFLYASARKRTLQKVTERLYLTYWRRIPHPTKFN